MLVQLCLENNSELQSFSGLALSKTRIATFLDEQEKPEIVAANFRPSIASNAPIDYSTVATCLFRSISRLGGLLMAMEMRATRPDQSLIIPKQGDGFRRIIARLGLDVGIGVARASGIFGYTLHWLGYRLHARWTNNRRGQCAARHNA